MYPRISHSHRRITVRRKSPNAGLLRHPPNRGAPDAVFSLLAKRFSGYLVSKNVIELMLPMDHPDLEVFTEVAKSLGLAMGTNRTNQLQIEVLDYTKYSEFEIDHSTHLECLLHRPVAEGILESNNDEGLGLTLDYPSFASQEIEIGSVPNLPHLIVVCGSARRQLEAAGLKGIQLLPLICTSVEHPSPSSDRAPAYIWSDVQLPPINLPFFDNDGNIIESSAGASVSAAKPLFILDGFEVLPALSYSDPLPEIDVAISRERIGSTAERYHRVVFSQKAQNILKEMGMELDCAPVRIHAATPK